MKELNSFPVSPDSCSESLRMALKTRKEYLDTLRKEKAPQKNPIQYKQTLLSYIHLLVSEMSQMSSKNQEDISQKALKNSKEYVHHSKKHLLPIEQWERKFCIK